MENQKYKIVVSSKKPLIWVLYFLSLAGFIFVVDIVFFSQQNIIVIFIAFFSGIFLIDFLFRVKVKFPNKQEIILNKENNILVFKCCGKEKKINLEKSKLDIEIKLRIPYYKIKLLNSASNEVIIEENDILLTKDEFIKLIETLSKLGLINKNIELEKVKKNIGFSYRPDEKIFIFKGKVYNLDSIEDITVKSVQKYVNGMYTYTQWFLDMDLKNGKKLETELFGDEVAQALKLEKDFYNLDEELMLIPNKPKIGVPTGIFIFLAGMILIFIASKLPYTPRQWTALLGLFLAFFGGLGTILYIFNTISLLISYKRLKNKL